MRILIDESLLAELADDIAGFDVSTAGHEGWTGLRNGVLLRTAVDCGFKVIITMDRSMPYQQNSQAIGVSVLVLKHVRNRLSEVRYLAPQILSILPLLRPGDPFEISPLWGDAICDRPAA